MRDITDPDYAAVATALALYSEPNITQQKVLADTAQQLLMTIEQDEKRAVATSKVARYLYRQGHAKEALLLFDQALKLAQQIQNIERRDAVLIILAIDQARVFLTDSANKTANLINTDNLKTGVLDMIKTFPITL